VSVIIMNSNCVYRVFVMRIWWKSGICLWKFKLCEAYCKIWRSEGGNCRWIF